MQLNMMISKSPEQRLVLFYSAFTCIYFPAILILLKYNNNIYNIGSYKFIPILLVLMFAEVVKLSFSLLQSESTIITKTEYKPSSKSKRFWTRILREIFKFIFFLITLSLIYYVVILLFGAPILTHREETIMLTITLSSLTFVPASLHLGVDTALSILLATQKLKGSLLVDAVKVNIKATLLGTWLGAIVIPLDWDRPWQAWPIPCVTGAFFGYMLAHFITLLKTLLMFETKKSNK
ncbi:phosphatidylinositol-glycan biosynthesis class F protein [Prorops nasuta]|uniref:phosphatidylinositol-glycan biosynthesis class F protein n=1 Tax=Prorops nasuta TaxID=863751 RepID=UPI0034CD4EAB